MEERRKHDDEVLVAITKLNSHFEKNGIIPAIKMDTQEHNHRLTKVESGITFAKGGLYILAVLVVPVLIYVSQQFINTRFLNPAKAVSDHELEELITEIINNELDQYVED